MLAAAESVAPSRKVADGGTLLDRLAALREAVSRAAGRAGGRPEEVRIVAVTKTLEAGRVREAAAAGLLDVGENYVQEAEAKGRALEDVSGLTWHFIGRLQTNKVKAVLRRFAWIHSVDRLGLLEEIARRCGAPSEGPSGNEFAVSPERAAEAAPTRTVAEEGQVPRKVALPGRQGNDRGRGRLADPKGPELLLQVNLDPDPAASSKAGFAEADVEAALLAAGRLGLKIRGLMTMTPLHPDPEMSRPYYARLRGLRDRLRHVSAGPTIELRELSMGMSGDFEVAIEEGATMIRVGTYLFGERAKGVQG